MMTSNNDYCVILAGGKGRRLWPCSRESYPKQFIDFFGTGKTQLQQTYERMTKFMSPDHVLVNTNIEYADLVRQQLPDLAENNLMAEPIHRNTAPSVAWVAHRVAHRNPYANLVVVPSDQVILDAEQFGRDLKEGLEFVANNNCLLTMGVKPTRPEPGYGYIQLGDYSHFDDIFKVQSFIEKPDREFAKAFMESGEWFWNTGIFLSNVHHLGMCLYKFLPSVLRNLDKVNPDFTEEEEGEYVREHFPSYPNISIDYGVLEKSENVYVKKCSFGWADVGTWHGIYEAMQKSDDDNVVINSDVLLEDCHNNVIKMPSGKLAVLNGLDGYIVAEKDNVLLVCKKEDSSALVKKYVNEVLIKKGEEYV